MKTFRRNRFRRVPQDDQCTGPRLIIIEAVLQRLPQVLASYGRDEEHEGVAYLGGMKCGEASVVLTAIAPEAQTTPGSFVTDVEANTAVVRALGKLGLILVGQAHSHPGDWVDHSEGDDKGALVRFEGYWSVVVPEYARQASLPLDKCGLHCYKQGRFWRLTEKAMAARVKAIPFSVDLRGK